MSDDDRRRGGAGSSSGPGGDREARDGRAERSSRGGRPDRAAGHDRAARRDHGPVELYLVRHAHAGDPATWPGPDEARPLSQKGERQAGGLAAFLARASVRPAVLVTSPRLRAVQTAGPIGAALGIPVRSEPLLGSGADLTDLEQILAGAGDPPSALLVGHDPDFSDIAAELTGAASLPLPKGSLVRIDAERPLVPGSGVLRWLLPPDLLAQA